MSGVSPSEADDARPDNSEPLDGLRVVVIGAGIAGICAAIRLGQAGVRDLVVLEKTDAVGGTWRENVYPGAACDVPSHLYSFSFAPNSEWSKVYADQPEILNYLKDCVEMFGIADCIRYGSEVVEARYGKETGHWRIDLAAGDSVVADILIVACGQLHRPNIPSFAGMETFAGQCMHSAQWRSDCDISGKNVAVIGSAASAVQIAVEITPKVGHLTVFQRTPNWIAPRFDRRYFAVEKWLMRHFPFLQSFHRQLNYLILELSLVVFRPDSLIGRFVAYATKLFMRRKILRTDLIQPLMPTYPMGCKRVLLSSTYLKMFRKEHVSLVTQNISHFTEHGVVTKDNVEHPADTVILATGFHVADLLAPIKIIGPDKNMLSDAWKEGPQAYLGMSVPKFPNMFVLYGPNTGLGHNSMIFMIECQVEYIRKLLEKMRQEKISELSVREDVSKVFNTQLQANMNGTSWGGNCSSWYKNDNGLVVAIWPYSTVRYWWLTREPKLSDFTTR